MSTVAGQKRRIHKIGNETGGEGGGRMRQEVRNRTQAARKPTRTARRTTRTVRVWTRTARTRARTART